MAPYDLLPASSPSLMKSLPSPYYSPYYSEYETLVTRVRLLEEEAARWRSLAGKMQQDQTTLAASESMAHVNFQMARAELDKQGAVLKSTDSQLVTVRDDLRRLFEASQRKEEMLAGEVARLKAELASSTADNNRLKVALEAEKATSNNRGDLLALRETEVQQLRKDLGVSVAENTRLRDELTISRAEGERLKLALGAEAATSKQRGELLVLRDTEVAQKSSEVAKLRTDLDLTLAHNRKVESDLGVTTKTLQTTGDVLNARNVECQKMAAELTDTNAREVSSRLKAARLEQDAQFWSEAYLQALQKPALPLTGSVPYPSSISRSKLLDAKAKALAFDETLARIRAGQKIY